MLTNAHQVTKTHAPNECHFDYYLMMLPVFTIHMHRCSQNTYFTASSTYSFFFHSFLFLSLCVCCFFFQLKSNENGLTESSKEKKHRVLMPLHNVINLNSMPENQKLIKYICSVCMCVCTQFTQYIYFIQIQNI